MEKIQTTPREIVLLNEKGKLVRSRYSIFNEKNFSTQPKVRYRISNNLILGLEKLIQY